MLQQLRHRVGDYLELRAIARHRSRLGRAVAPRYTAYLRECQRRFRDTVDPGPALRRAVAAFEKKNVATFWTDETGRLATSMMRKIEAAETSGAHLWNDRGQHIAGIYAAFPEIEGLFNGSIGRFLRGAFRAEFKIYYGVVYKSEREEEVPTGSQLWHADGGPGTCIILMIYLRDVTPEDGALECLSWEASLETYRNERAEYRRRLDDATRGGRKLSREELRKIKCDYFEEAIDSRHRASIEQPVGPAGTVVAFGNNVLHRGGFPASGHKRYVALFHCYPSTRPTPFERYRTQGIQKAETYPSDPAAEF